MIEKFIRWYFSYYWHGAYNRGYREAESHQRLMDMRKIKK